MPPRLRCSHVLIAAAWFVSTPVLAEEQNELIVFDSKWIPEQVESRNIFVVRADGTGLRQITQAGEGQMLKHAMFPSWSGNHKQIMFRGYDHHNKSQRFVISVSGEDSKPELVKESGTVSPDGKYVLIDKSDDAGLPAVFVKTAGGPEVRQISPSGVPASQAQWSPDGDRILFLSRKKNETDIYVMKVDGSNVIRLTENQGHKQTPDWSPDAKTIVFASTRDGNLEIYLTQSDGRNTRRLTDHPKADVNPAFSPDGTRIVFMAERALCLHVMDVDGANMRALSSAVGNHADW